MIGSFVEKHPLVSPVKKLFARTICDSKRSRDDCCAHPN